MTARALTALTISVLAFPALALGQARNPASTQAGGTVFVGVAATAFQKGNLDGHPTGLSGGATASNGAGLGVRWAVVRDLHFWSVGFMQVTPSIRGAKSVQPMAFAGICGAVRAGEQATCVEVGGGVLAFLGSGLGVGIDFRYLHGFEPLGTDEVRERQVSFSLLWRF